MALYALRISRSLLAGNIDRVTLYDTSTGKTCSISERLLLKRMGSDKNYVTNMYLDNEKGIHIRNIHGNRKGYCRKTFRRGHIEEYYIVALGFDNGMINYISCKDNGEVMHMLSTLEEMMYEVGATDNEINISNARCRLHNGELTVSIFDFEAGEESSSKYIGSSNISLQMRANNSNYSNIEVRSDKDGIRVDAEYDGIGAVDIPDNVEKIGYIDGVNTVKAGRMTREVCEYSMFESNDIVRFDGNNSVERIGDCAFKQSTVYRLKNIDSVRYIGKEAFAESLLSGSIELNAEVIEQKAFYYTAIKRIKLNNTKVIGKGAFAYTYNLSEVDLGEAVQVIEELAFKSSQIKELTVPRSCKLICKGAFDSCRKLKKVYVYKGTRIVPGAFGSKCKVVLYE